MAKHNILVERKKEKHGGFIVTNVKNYITHSTPRELFFDIVIPIVLSTILIVLIYFMLPSPITFVKSMYEINNTIITIIAILAGFNSASLAIIASSSKIVNSELLDTESIKTNKTSNIQKIKNMILNSPSYKELDAIVSFFAYAVISQLIILIISLIIHVILTALMKVNVHFTLFSNQKEMIILCIFSGFWLTLVLHSIFLSIRNIDIIAHFIKYSSKKD